MSDGTMISRRKTIGLLGLAALDAATGHASRRRAVGVIPRDAPVLPVPSRLVATGIPLGHDAYGTGPAKLGLGIHNCGWGCANDLFPTVDQLRPEWVRVGTANGIYPADPQDDLITGLMARGTSILYVVGGENGKPADEDMVIGRLRSAIAAYPRITHYQPLNEPCNFHNMDPDVYVRSIIVPSRKVIDEENARRLPAGLQALKLVSTGFFGTLRGVEETRVALDAGMARYIDILGVHLYGDQAVTSAQRYRNMAGRLPIFVTENGVNSYDHHAQWYFGVGSGIERAIGGPSWHGTDQMLFWYVLAGDREFGIVHEWRGAPEYTSELGPRLEIRVR